MNYPTRQDVIDAIARQQEQIHAQASAKAKTEGHTELLGASWFECTACKTGLALTLSAVIAVAIAGFPEDTPAIAAIAAACGISEAAVIAILAEGEAGLESVILSLCEAMGACS